MNSQPHILLAVLALALSRIGTAAETVDSANVKITFAASSAGALPSPPAEASLPKDWDSREHGTFAGVVAGRIATLTITAVDAKSFKDERQIESLLRELLSTPYSETWTCHVWSFGDGAPSLIADVVHPTGKPGKWFLWCARHPGCYWAYQDGDGKWWWGDWEAWKHPGPASLDPAPRPSTLSR